MSNIDMRKGYEPVDILIYDRKKDIVFKEISLVALNKSDGKVLATGNDAIPLIDSTDNNIVVLSPLKFGIIADYRIAQLMFQDMLKKASLLKSIFKPKVTICVPANITEVERTAFQEAFLQMGIRELSISEKTAEEMSQVLHSSYSVIVEIVQNSEQAKKEKWEEICKNKIPMSIYRFDSISNYKSEITVTLYSNINRVELKFHRTIAMRITEKDFIPDGLYSENEIDKYKEDSFKNIIYRINDGEFSNFIMKSRKGKITNTYIKHYIIIIEDSIVEILSESEPDILLYELSSN